MAHKHKTRFSDSSMYDEVCVKCGETDNNGGRLNGSCHVPDKPVPSCDRCHRHHFRWEHCK